MPVLREQNTFQDSKRGKEDKGKIKNFHFAKIFVKMNLKADIVIDRDADLLYKCFKPEMNKWERAQIKMKKSKGNLHFSIEAQDAVALRATLNSITGLLSVYEKTSKLLK